MCAAVLLCVPGCGDAPEGFVGELLRAERGGRDTPLLSRAEPGADLERAYAVQREFVTLRFGGGVIGGYKAGLTTAGARARFGASEPVAGVLPRTGRLEGARRIDASAFRRLIVELEFAFEMGDNVNRALADTDAVRAVVSALRPAVELPDVGFPSLEGLQMVDLVAANVAASHLLVGEPVAPGSVDLRSIHATLSRDGETAIDYRGTESELEPWEAIRWLVNERLRRGWPVRRGQILIAGSLGEPAPGVAGAYRADFGPLGTLDFDITD